MKIGVFEQTRLVFIYLQNVSPRFLWEMQLFYFFLTDSGIRVFSHDIAWSIKLSGLNESLKISLEYDFFFFFFLVLC